MSDAPTVEMELRDAIEQFLYDKNARIVEKNDSPAMTAALGVCYRDALVWISIAPAHIEID